MKSHPIFLSVTLSLALAVCGSEFAESVSSPRSLVPEGLKPVVDTAKDMSAVYSGVTDAIRLLQLVGLIPTDPSAEERLQQIEEDLKRLGSIIYNQNIALARVEHRAAAQTAANFAERSAADLLAGREPTLIEGGEIDFASELAVTHALQPELFQRLYDESVNDGGTDWKVFIPARPERDDDTIYDWRLNIPHLMYMIALRFKVMTAVHPEWRMDGHYDHTSLKLWAEELDRHLKRMLAGVRCGFDVFAREILSNDRPVTYEVETWVGCADIYTGISSVYKLDALGFGDSPFLFICGGYCPSGFYCGPDFYNHDVCVSELPLSDPFFFDVLISIQDAAYREVVRQMPIFEMQSMIDTLNFYLSHAPDLTARNRRIPAEDAPGLCLAVQSGNPDSGTPVWLSPCTGGVAQRWEYDRVRGQIRNPWADKCLDVQWANPMAETPVWIWDCNETDAQQWTYDPVTNVLQSALSTVLTVPGENLQAQTPLVMSWRSDYPAPTPDLVLPDPRSQRWHADSFTITIEVPAVGDENQGDGTLSVQQ
jgi:hypothetical protein